MDLLNAEHLKSVPFHIFGFSGMNVYIVRYSYHNFRILKSQLKMHEILLHSYNFEYSYFRTYDEKRSKHRYTFIPRIH